MHQVIRLVCFAGLASSVVGGGCNGASGAPQQGSHCEGKEDCASSGLLCVGGYCSSCSTDDDCGEVGFGACRNDGVCVECLHDAECPASIPWCLRSGRCAECLTDSDCWDGAPICDQGKCVPCGEDGACSAEQELRSAIARLCASSIETRQDDVDSKGAEALLCSGRIEEVARLALLLEAARAGTVTVDTSQLAECSFDIGDEWLGFRTCPAVKPTLAVEEVCSVDLECNTGVCTVAENSCGGVCWSSDNLDDCRTSVDCDAGQRCFAGECMGLPGAGQSCTDACAGELRCVHGECAPAKADGEACAVDEECQRGGRCVDERCARVLGPGEQCAADDLCALGTSCVDGRCRPLPDVDEICVDEACLRGECANGVCVAAGLASACPEVASNSFDMLDPCGNEASCAKSGDGWVCARERDVGADCGGPADPPCRRLAATCSTTGACVAECRP